MLAACARKCGGVENLRYRAKSVAAPPMAPPTLPMMSVPSEVPPRTPKPKPKPKPRAEARARAVAMAEEECLAGTCALGKAEVWRAPAMHEEPVLQLFRCRCREVAAAVEKLPPFGL